MGLYNWRSKALIDLPMGHADHDAVNTRTLNRGRGGAALDAVFGAGAATPTKLTDRHGYSFDGGDNLVISAVPQPTTAFSVCFTISDRNAAAVQRTYGDHRAAGAVNWLLNRSAATGKYQFHVGAVTAFQAATIAGDEAPTKHTVVGVWDATGTRLFVDGIRGADAATPLAPSGGAIDLHLAQTYVGGFRLTGDILGFEFLNGIALTHHQVTQYHLAAMRALHRI